MSDDHDSRHCQVLYRSDAVRGLTQRFRQRYGREARRSLGCSAKLLVDQGASKTSLPLAPAKTAADMSSVIEKTVWERCVAADPADGRRSSDDLGLRRQQFGIGKATVGLIGTAISPSVMRPVARWSLQIRNCLVAARFVRP